MTENDTASRVLTDEEIQDTADGFDIYGAKPEFARAIEQAVLSKLRAPVADEREAARYRWIRAQKNAWAVLGDAFDLPSEDDGVDGLDASIDAAIAATRKGKK